MSDRTKRAMKRLRQPKRCVAIVDPMDNDDDDDEDDDEDEPEVWRLEGVNYYSYFDYLEARWARVAKIWNIIIISYLRDNGETPPPQPKAAVVAVAVKKQTKPHRLAPETPTRTSARIVGKTPEYVDEAILDDDFEYCCDPVQKRPKLTAAKREVTIELSEDQRATLSQCDNWLCEMESFLSSVPHGKMNRVCSSDNVRQVMKQVKLLVSGCGIGYRHWPSDVVFMKGNKVCLDEDFDILHDRAQCFENTHGHDLGNGWLLRHPIVKLKLFQEYMHGKISTV